LSRVEVLEMFLTVQQFIRQGSPYEMCSIFHRGEAHFTGKFCILPIEFFRSIGALVHKFCTDCHEHY